MRVLYVATDLRDADILKQEVRRASPELTFDLCVGLAALRQRQDQPSSYDILLMDCALPEAEQLQLIHHIRVRQLALPIVALALANGAAPAAALGAGADDFIVRGPKTADRLVQTLRVSAERYRTMANTQREHEKLKRSEARLRLIIEALPTGVVLLDEAGKVLAMNAAGVEYFGSVSPQDIVSRQFATLIPVEDHPALREFLDKVNAGEEAGLQFSSLVYDEAPQVFNLRGLCIQREQAGQTAVLGVIERVGAAAGGATSEWSADLDLGVSGLISPLLDLEGPPGLTPEPVSAATLESEARAKAAEERAAVVEAELAVAQAALTEAETQQRTAAERLRELEASIAAMAGERDDLRQAMTQAQEQQRALDARVADAGAQLQAAVERASQLDAQRHEAAERASHLEAQQREADERAAQAEAQQREAHDRITQVDAQRHEAAERASHLEAQQREAEERVARAEASQREAHDRLAQVDAQRHEAAERASHLEAQQRETEERVARAEALQREADERAAQAEVQQREAHERLTQVDAQRHEAVERASHLEAQQRDAHERVSQTEMQRHAADERASQLEGQQREADERAARAEAQQRAAEERVTQAEQRTREAEQALHAQQQAALHGVEAGEALSARLASLEGLLRDRDILLDAKQLAIDDRDARLAAFDAGAAHHAARGAALEQALREKDDLLDSNRTALAERDVRLADREAELAVHGARLIAIERALGEKDALIEAKQALIGEKDVLIGEQDAELAARANRLGEATTKAESFDGVRHALDRAREELEAARAELGSMSQTLAAQREAHERLQATLTRKETDALHVERRAQARIAELERDHRAAADRLQDMVDQAAKDSAASARGLSADPARRGSERLGRLAAAMAGDLHAAVGTAAEAVRALAAASGAGMGAGQASGSGSDRHAMDRHSADRHGVDRDGVDRETANRALDTILRCGELARHLLRLSTRYMSQSTGVDLGHLVRQQEALLRHLAGPDIELHCDLAPRLVSSDVDSQDLTHVLTSLIVAARDALPLGGAIRVATSSQPVDTHPLAHAHDAARGERPRPLVLSVSAKGYGIRPVPSSSCEEVTERCGGLLTTVIEPNVSWTLMAMLPGGVADEEPAHEHESSRAHAHAAGTADLTRSA